MCMCFHNMFKSYARRKLQARSHPDAYITTGELAILISDVPFMFRSTVAGHILREHRRLTKKVERIKQNGGIY